MQNDAEKSPGAAPSNGKKSFGCLQVAGIVFVAVVLTAVISGLAVKTYLFPSAFEPVTLNAQEERELSSKLERIEARGIVTREQREAVRDSRGQSRTGPLVPERYNEEGASREIHFTEREINALIAGNPDLAGKVAIDFAENLVSAKLLIPVDDDFPVLGGKTIRVRAGVQLAYRDARPEVILKGVSMMGVPLPNAWLGGIKNRDLVKETGAGDGFWQAFADGVEDIRAGEGFVKVTLKE